MIDKTDRVEEVSNEESSETSSLKTDSELANGDEEADPDRVSPMNPQKLFDISKEL